MPKCKMQNPALSSSAKGPPTLRRPDRPRHRLDEFMACYFLHGILHAFFARVGTPFGPQIKQNSLKHLKKAVFERCCLSTLVFVYVFP